MTSDDKEKGPLALFTSGWCIFIFQSPPFPWRPTNTPKPEERSSPKALLRARRPELFSDSVIEQSKFLDRSIIEYHLEIPTTRSHEIDFEHFAHRLAEREICPNLTPHTGPIAAIANAAASNSIVEWNEPNVDAISCPHWHARCLFTLAERQSKLKCVRNRSLFNCAR